jgi:hypothetical protein
VSQIDDDEVDRARHGNGVDVHRRTLEAELHHRAP